MQTSVEWLDNELWKLRLKLRGGEISIKFYFEQEVKLIEQAKEMEKQQAFEFWQGGIKCTEEGGKSFDQYYNETFKK
jgi:hypothetical protein